MSWIRTRGDRDGVGSDPEVGALIEERDEARAVASMAEELAERHLIALVRTLHVAAAEGPAAALVHVADHLVAVRARLEPGDPEAFGAAVGRARVLEDHAAGLAAVDRGVSRRAPRRRSGSVWCQDHTPVDLRRNEGG